MLVDLGGGPMGQTVALVLAQEPGPPLDKGEEFGKASPIGLVVILLLGIATVFLIRSMTKHLRKVPTSFDPPPRASAADAPAETLEQRAPSRTAENGASRPSDVEPSPDR